MGRSPSPNYRFEPLAAGSVLIISVNDSNVSICIYYIIIESVDITLVIPNSVVEDIDTLLSPPPLKITKNAKGGVQPPSL